MTDSNANRYIFHDPANTPSGNLLKWSEPVILDKLFGEQESKILHH